MSQAYFRVETEDTLVDSRLLEDEIQQALNFLERFSTSTQSGLDSHSHTSSK
jgi:hypothetical protein